MYVNIPIAILLALITLLPLAWKWQLGISRIGALVILITLPAGLIVAFLGSRLSISLPLLVGFTWLIAVLAVFAFLAYRFYRDPERYVPDLPGVIVSPADGKVIYIRKSRGDVASYDQARAGLPPT